MMNVSNILSLQVEIANSKNTKKMHKQLETVSIAEPLQNRQHAQNP